MVRGEGEVARKQKIASDLPPIPFGGLLVFFCNLIISSCGLYCMIVFPSELRNNQQFRSKINPYLMYEFWWLFINLQRDVLTFAFKAIPGELQFIFALLIPTIKEINKILHSISM